MASHITAKRRNTIRLQSYDYTQPGAYFITLCTQNRICYFGDVINHEMHLNASGHMIFQDWIDLPKTFPTISIDAYILMPNHLHGIIQIHQKNGKSINHIMRYFKAISTYHYSLGVKMSHWPAYSGHLWQRNYYEHIIRTPAALAEIREYIVNNACKWDVDVYHPKKL